MSTTLAEAFSELKSDYNAARRSRFRRRRPGVNGVGRNADWHYRTDRDYFKIVELSRDFDRNDVVVGQGVTRLVDNVIQDGFRLDPMTGDPGLDTELQNRWEDWSTEPDECDVAGELDFHQFERLALRQVVVDGDILLLPLRTGELEAVEGHRLRTPTNTTQNVIHGVLLNQQRKRLEYWLTRDDIDPMAPLSKVADVKRFPARDVDGQRAVFHVYNPKRVSQTRGVSAFAPIVDAIGMHDDIQFAKLVQQQIVSCFTILRQRSEAYSGSGGFQVGSQETEQRADGSTRTIEGLSPGKEITGNPGETLTGFSPNVPNPEFFPHASLILTFIAINLSLPLQVLLLDPTKTNFSGWRGAMDQARLSFREFQKWLSCVVHRRVYLWKVRQWLAQDAAMGRSITEPTNPFKHRWNYPVWPYIEPLKEVSADLMRIRNGLTSPRRLHAERGRDWAEITTEMVEDNGMAIRKAKTEAAAINAEFPEDEAVHWRELLTITTPDGLSVTTGASQPEQQEQPQEAEDGG